MRLRSNSSLPSSIRWSLQTNERVAEPALEPTAASGLRLLAVLSALRASTAARRERWATVMRFRIVRTRALITALCLGASVAGATTVWVLGSQLIRPVNRSVPLPAGFPAQVISLDGPGHAIAGWWLDQGGSSPVVLLLHSIRADRLSMLSRAKLLSGHGFSVLLIDLQGHVLGIVFATSASEPDQAYALTDDEIRIALQHTHSPQSSIDTSHMSCAA